GLLVELLDAVGQTEADDGTDVGLVDAETKGNGADEDAHLLGHPLFLIFAASLAAHLSVILDRGDALLAEEIDDFTDASHRGSVYDYISSRSGFYRSQQQLVLHTALAELDEVTQILAAKTENGAEGIA